MLRTVIRRDRFDAMLARAASEAGVEIVQRDRVLDVAQDADSVRVSTERGIFEAQVLVGADGSGSRVRRAVFGARKETIGRALMTDIAVDPERTPEFTEQRYRFDFRCVSGGINGYSWSFPCLIGGRPHLNVGIYDQRPREFAERRRRTIADDRGTRRGVSRTSARRLKAARDAMAFVPDSMVRRRGQLRIADASFSPATRQELIR